MTLQVTTESPEQTMALAAALARRLRGGDFIALDGPLGSGKTCFVRGLARGLGIDEREVASPTFIIRTEYEPPADADGALTLVHVDAYRLTDPAELDELGWNELLRRVGSAGGGGGAAVGDVRGVVIAVEWADRIASALPEERIAVSLGHVDEQRRAITIDAPTTILAGLETAASSPESMSNDRCPICASPVKPSAESFPFCSARCRYVDLGNWLDESHRIAGPHSEDVDT